MSDTVANAAPDGATVPGGGEGGNGNARAQAETPAWLTMINRILLMYFFYNFFFRSGAAPAGSLPDAEVSRNLFSVGDPIDVYFFLSYSAAPPRSLGDGRYSGNATLLWNTKTFYGAWETDEDMDQFSLEHTFVPSDDVRLHNASMHAHVFVTRNGAPYHPESANYRPQNVAHGYKLLTRYMPRRAERHLKNLLTGEGGATTDTAPLGVTNGDASMDDQASDSLSVDEFFDGDTDLGSINGDASALASNDGKPVEYISYWCPNVTVNLVVDTEVHNRKAMPTHLLEHGLKLDAATGNYYPVVYMNDFFMLQEHLNPINETVANLTVAFSFYHLSQWKWVMMEQMDKAFGMHQSWGSMGDKERDEMKRLIFETNIYLLALTFTVSLLHSVFDFLAFKNDIQFWRNRKTVEGLSVRSVITNVFFQLVILLYLIDSEQTSYIIIVSSAVGLAIEVWKLKRAMKISLDYANTFYGIPRIRFDDHDSYHQSKTKEYDALAFQYLSYALYPLIFCYAIYSLVYDTHKSWYSFVLSTLVGCVYTFGFILMTPQLFINYKLKSVAHLPWRMLTYKALNTFVDDLFAFVIRMPTMHRLACFRDDIIFFIYLYQRWKYPVDPNRRNEFEGGDAADAAEEEERARLAALTATQSQNADPPTQSKTETETRTGTEAAHTLPERETLSDDTDVPDSSVISPKSTHEKKTE